MKITKIQIKKFRGFVQQETELGSHVTVITGRNGTQKSTLLGLLSQTFTINQNSPMYGEKPLCGGNYRSSFQEKFRLSDRYDIPGEHEWTLYFDDEEPFTVESIARRTKNSTSLRFWKKGAREAGDGYIEFPVIFLSLQRLIPIAETNAKEYKSESLTEDESKFFISNKNKILSTSKEITSSISVVAGSQKNTLGTNTDRYDWQQNSSGQDNLGKIISAVISFQRLKQKYKNDYRGGLLVIDELDATMHPASQEKLFDFLYQQASRINIQVILTTHSLSLMNYVCQKIVGQKEQVKKQLKILVLEKKDNLIYIQKGENFRFIKNILTLTVELPEEQRLKVFTEDPEDAAFARNILGRQIPMRFESNNLSCDMYKELLRHKVSSFLSKDVIIILDGDAKDVKNKNKNLFFLPGNLSPERELATYLENLEESSSIWNQIHPGYNYYVCFRDTTYEEVSHDRKKAKEWFNKQKKSYKNWFSVVMKNWKKENSKEVEKFKESIRNYYSKVFLPSIKL